MPFMMALFLGGLLLPPGSSFDLDPGSSFDLDPGSSFGCSDTCAGPGSSSGHCSTADLLCRRLCRLCLRPFCKVRGPEEIACDHRLVVHAVAPAIAEGNSAHTEAFLLGESS